MSQVDIVESFKRGVGPGLHSGYTQVNVLLIHWAKNDLGGVEKEIQDLQSVFEADYNYNTLIFRIPDNDSHRQRLNTEISCFVENKSQRDSLIIVYYAGHCSPDELGQAEWAALEEGGPSLSWNAGQQILFSAPGDVLLILDCCFASLITPGLKNQGTRFELIAASARSARTPMPGPRSLTRVLTKVLKEHADEGISSENLSSRLRENNKITETPVFHNFARKSPTSIRLQRLAHDRGFIPKPSRYLFLRVSLTGEVTGAQMAEWLKSAPPDHVAAVHLEAVVNRGSQGNSSNSNSQQDTPEDMGAHSLPAATGTDVLCPLHQEPADESPVLQETEISFKDIAFKKGKRQRSSWGKYYRQRFKYGSIAGHPVLMDIYKDKEAGADGSILHAQVLHQARQVTELLCHIKPTGLPVLPCVGFFRDQSRRELGLVFKLPPNLEADGDGCVRTLFELYRAHKLVSLGHRMHLAFSLITSIERFHSVGWVHKSIRSNSIAFTAKSTTPSALELSGKEYEDPLSSYLGDFDLGNPLLFGFEYARAGDAATYFNEDYKQVNNLYRIPERWGKPTARFEKSHDVYSLGVVLLEIALWKDPALEVRSSERVLCAE
ncbi:hypothetical protein BHE90_000052 [Fusarium euwallaceae]|uniref:Protein kinase domain-containing protein n=2 Tax=Fusarium solani species complex TaxID=232080 RepID=A0A430MBC0_9HYPO|nr:hypothetical protein CEP51_001778 [Fusarium floridanum]RTE85307.1 hypothetical protein BHE90_000052 [Fusarium euwallaceae]